MLSRLFEKKPAKNTVVYTTHKAGSMVLHGVLREICQGNRIPYYTPNTSGAKKFPYERALDGDDFIAKHRGCFGALRFFVPSAALADSRVVLHLRDPRDVLTSMFFSYCYMHPARYPGEIEPDTGYRKEVAEAGIDEFVLRMTDERFAEIQGDYGTGCNFGSRIGNMRTRYERYVDELLPLESVTLVSYEEMVLDFGSWLEKMVGAFELSDPDKTIGSLRESYAGSFDASGGEDVTSHKRKVTPGDHVEKLKPETIAELDRRLGRVLERLGYFSEEFKATSIPRVGEPASPARAAE